MFRTILFLTIFCASMLEASEKLFVRSTLLDSEPKVKSALTDLAIYSLPHEFTRKCVVSGDGKIVDFPLSFHSVMDWDKLMDNPEIPAGYPSAWVEITEQIYAPFKQSPWQRQGRSYAAQVLFMGFFARENDTRNDRRPIFKTLELGNLKNVRARIDFATSPDTSAIVKSIEYSSGNSCVPVLLEPTDRNLPAWGKSITTLRSNVEKRIEALKAAGVTPVPAPKRIIISRRLSPGRFYSVFDPETVAKEIELAKLIGIHSLQWWCDNPPSDFDSYADMGLSPLFREGTRPDWLTKYPWDIKFEQKVIQAAAKFKIPSEQKMLMKFGDETTNLPEKIIDGNPVALSKFREYLAAHNVKPDEIGYTSLSEAHFLNKRQTEFKNNAECYLYLQTMLFRSDMMIDWYKRLISGMKQVHGDRLITTGELCWEDATNTPDIFQLAKSGALDVASHELSTLLWVMPYGAIYRTVALRTAGRYTTTLPGVLYGSTRGGVNMADIIELDGTTALINGMRHFYWYNDGPDIMPGGIPTTFDRSIAHISQRVARLEDWIVDGDSPNRYPRAALVKSYTSELFGGNVRNTYFQEFELAAAGLAWNQIPFDIIPDEWISETLKNYDVLYLATPNLSDAVRPVIISWVKSGGRLVIIGKAASRNERNTLVSFYGALGGNEKLTAGTIMSPVGKGYVIRIADELGARIRQSLVPLDDKLPVKSVFHKFDEGLVKRYLAPFDLEPKLQRPIIVNRVGVDATFYEKKNRESAVIILTDYTDKSEKEITVSVMTSGSYGRCEDEAGRLLKIRRENNRTIIENVPLSISTVLMLR